MKRLITALCFTLLAGGAVMPVHAQLAPGISGYSGAPIEGSQRDYWYLVRQLGDCMSTSKQDESIHFLTTGPGSRAENAAWDDLFNNGRSNNPCMRNFVSASIVRAHVRGAIAESIFKRRIAEQDARFVPVLSEPATITTIHDFADCYVASHFDNAQGLLDKTKLSTQGELQFVQEIVSEFPPCLPNYENIRIVPTDIRLALAEALYRTTITAGVAEVGDSESVGG